MAKAPITQLKKQEIIDLYKRRCKHGHRYLEHYSCYLKESATPQKVGFFDIETSNLNADFGIMFCYAIKEAGTSNIVEYCVTAEQLEENLDKAVIKQCIEDIQKYDLLVTYYGTGFDLPFLRARALYWGLDFPDFGLIQHKDVFYIIKSKFKISRRSLENACRVLLGKTEKNHIDARYWIKALRGDKKSLAYILDHCERDVRDLEKLYNTVIKFAKNTTKSI